jgi:peptide/nickel transport system permease protein
MTEAVRGQSWSQRIVSEVGLRWGARLGIAWIGLLTLLAVFAPLLANSHPLLMQDADGWHSPMLVHLSPADTTLLGIFFLTLLLVSASRTPAVALPGLAGWRGRGGRPVLGAGVTAVPGGL